MRKNKKLFVIVGSALLLLIGLTTLYAASTYWSGTGWGQCTIGGQTVYPFCYWNDEWDDVTDSFIGTWSDNNSHTGIFEAAVGPNDTIIGTWKCDQVDINPSYSTDDIIGGFHGRFYIADDTVHGVWDSDSLKDDGIGNGCNGTWRGEED